MNTPGDSRADSNRAASSPVMRNEALPASSLWRAVPMGDYAVPSHDGDATSLMEKGWKSLRRFLKPVNDKADFACAEGELRALPAVRLSHLVPPIDWSSVAAGIRDALDEIAISEPDRRMSDHRASTVDGGTTRLLIGQPFCDHSQIVRHWATRRQARVLSPPDSMQILSGDTSWLSTLPGRDGPLWVMPALERCFLRHANGLDLVRHFLERAFSGEMGAGVIACDSWAFAFINRVWPLPGASMLTLQAFDGPALANYFLSPEDDSDHRSQTRFLSTRSGKPLLPVSPPNSSQADGADSKHQNSLPELDQLAAHCRGNPGLAWHYWREQLRAAPDHVQQSRAKDKESARSGESRAGQAPDDVVWVGHDVETPSLPAESDEDVAFLLHALLLHRGLTIDLLALLLPVPRARIASQFLRLQAMGLLVRRGECWQIAPLAYSTVREFLRARSYLIDAF